MAAATVNQIIAFHKEGRPGSEIAALLGISRNKVTGVIFRLKQRVKAKAIPPTDPRAIKRSERTWEEPKQTILPKSAKPIMGIAERIMTPDKTVEDEWYKGRSYG